MAYTGKHAIVLGASMAGLLTARVLSERFEHVTLIERDLLPDGAEVRKGTPQGRHVHGIWPRGAAIMDRLYPGLLRDLIAGGAMVGDVAGDIRWHQFGGYKVKHNVGIPGLLLSRPYLEGHVRQRALQLPNLTVLQETDILALAANADRSRVTGVTIRRAGGVEETLAGDLIVDATGRAGQSPKWLEALGYARPAESVVKVNVGYATRTYARQSDDDAGANGFLSVGAAPHSKRLGVCFAVEGPRWILTLGGLHADYPPADEAGFLEFARSLPTADIYNLIRKVTPLGDIVTYRFPANLRRHYEKMTRFPQGYLVIGDAVCSFNPIYGQGMTVAAREAETLEACLAASSNLDGLAVRFFKQVQPVIDIPWTLATGEDFRYPETEGVRPSMLNTINSYVVKVHYAARTDPVVCRAFFQVAGLEKAPTSLFHPAILWRVLKVRGNAARPMASAAEPTLA